MHFLRFLVLFLWIPTILFSDEFQLNEYSTANNQALCELMKIIKTGLNGQLLEKKWGSCVKTSYNHASYNYCFIKNPLESKSEFEAVLSEIKTFYGTTQHTILIDKQNEQMRDEFAKKNFELSQDTAGYYLLIKPFNDTSKFSPIDVTFKRVANENEARQWAKVVASTYGDNEEEVFKLCKNNLSNSAAHFFLAYHKEEPVSARAIIVYDRNAAGVMAATVSEYRHKGIAGALFSYALETLKKSHSIQMYVMQTLPAGPMPLKKLKFIEHGDHYYAYKTK
jgi:ribosomal protein S18 acetylase RimI-like enzyme